MTSPLLSLVALLLLQQATLHSTAGSPAVSKTRNPPAAATNSLNAGVNVQLLEADGSQVGQLSLKIEARSTESADTLLLSIPLASTGDAYGESRACTTAANGARTLVFMAGLDERNFVRFHPDPTPLAVKLLVNKYLCRALAAPFQCGAQQVKLPGDWSHWRLAATTRVELESKAPAAVELSPISLTVGPAFDPKSCPVIAPSNGVCCVSGRETNWHCGGKPAVGDWHQVSGDCFHQETGRSCKD